MLTENAAIDFIYQSYLKAEKYQDYQAPDSQKRHPEYMKPFLEKEGTPAILVTGSKGKGSVAHMIAAILAGKYTVGLMTSPHVLSFRERFRVNGEMIPSDKLAFYVEAYKDRLEQLDAQIPRDCYISPMGIQALVARDYFRDCHTDWNVFECGKGVQYDDVNLIPHKYGVINSIFPEHLRELGGTIESIAEDKSHIITGEQECIYVAEQVPSVMRILRERAKQYRVPMKCYGTDFGCEDIRYSKSGMIFTVWTGKDRYTDLRVPLLGEHQAKNCALAIAVCEDILQKMPKGKTREQLKQVCCPGRMEVLSRAPFVMLDASIRRENVKYVKEVLRLLKIKKVCAIVGIPDDKDYLGVCTEIGEVAGNILLTKSSNPHYRFTKLQEETLGKTGRKVCTTDNIKEAYQKALQLGLPIVILGTTSLVSDVKREWPLVP